MEKGISAKETELVRCLHCGTVYSQPPGGHDAPGCPECGYVGWIVEKPPHQGQKSAP
jgi:predicted  nucleic acid-binding Zn-ribbon protein